MKSSTKNKAVRHNELIEINERQQKKQYRSPRFEVLTPDQAMATLTERGLPGEAAAEHFLKAGYKSGPSANPQRSNADGVKSHQTKSRQPRERN